MRDGWTNPSRPSVVSGERASRGSAATKSAASLTAFTSLPFAVPGCSPRPSIVHLQLAGRERLDLELADTRAVERVGGLGAERLDVEVVGAAAHLLVDRERDAHRRARLGRAAEVRDGRHDLRHAGLVVGSEQRRAVARDDVVPDARRERRLLGRVEHLARVARAARSARRRSPRARSGRRRRPATPASCRRGRSARSRALPACRAASRSRSRTRSARHRRARSLAARPRGCARGRAASRCSGYVEAPSSDCVSIADVAEEALEHARRPARPRAARRTGR